MFIKYNPKNPHIKVVPIVSNSAAVAAGSVILTPGTNEISDEDWNAIKAHLESEIADGTIKPFSVAKNGATNAPKVKTLKDVPPAIAAKIVAECSSKETLRKWFNDNLSDELALLVLKRIRQLKMDIDEIESEENTLLDSDITVEKDDSKGNPAGDDGKNNGGKNNRGGKNNGSGKTGSDNGDGNPDPNANGGDGNGGDDGTPKFDDPNAKVD